MTNRMDHTACTHDRTPKGRAACRKAKVDAVTAIFTRLIANSTPISKMAGAKACTTNDYSPTAIARRG